MTSSAHQHKMRVLAARATANAVPGSAVDADTSQAHRLIRAKLDTDRRRLHDIHSVERKIAVKRELIDEYDDYVNGVLASGVGVQDEVLCYVMLWRLDIGDFRRGFEIARYVLQHGLAMPDQHRRTPAAIIADVPSDEALRAFKRNEPFDVEILRETMELVGERDIPDQAKAKLHFALGRHLIQDEPQEAIAHLRRAVDLHEHVGAKKDIERLEARLRREATNNESGTAAGNDTTSSDGT